MVPSWSVACGSATAEGEFAAAYRRYHACLMQTFPIGEDCPEQRHMYGACRAALDAMTAATLPGRALGDIDSSLEPAAGPPPHRRVTLAATHTQRSPRRAHTSV
jgi:hypothetical protein